MLPMIGNVTFCNLCIPILQGSRIFAIFSTFSSSLNIYQNNFIRGFPSIIPVFHVLGKILVLSTMYRSGAAALCQILHCAGERDNRLTAYATPDVFSVLAIYAEDFFVMGLEKLRQVLLASIRYFCKDQSLDQTIVL